MLRPDNDSWVAVLYDSADSGAARLGTATVIDAFRLLTCHHVVAVDGLARDRVWVAFPKAVSSLQRRQWTATVERADAELDVALLRLTEHVPRGVAAAPLRRPTPGALVGQRWWAFGFTAGSRHGSSAYGTVGESLGDGYVRLDADRSAQYRLRRGFSGSGVWSPDAAGIVGVLVTADELGNGEAISVHQLDLRFPEEKLRELALWTIDDADDVALAAWSLHTDQEAATHWGPRARGVAVDTDSGFRFRGRTAALTAIVDWLDRDDPNNQVLVVTGSPGAGKSAVLGRIVTTADPELRKRAPQDDYVRAPAGSVACGVHVKGKTALEVATEIARAASAALPDTLNDFAAGIREALSDLGSYRFNIIIDALDEATSPGQARAIVTEVILPLVSTCADIGVQVVVASRGYDDEGDLLGLFDAAAIVVNLDDSRYFQPEDLAAYALATLQLSGAERLGNPYADERVAGPVAARIAVLSRQNFLIAGLTAFDHGRHDDTPVHPDTVAVAGEVEDVLLGYLERLEPVSGLSAAMALTALAFAEAPGLPLDLWQEAVYALTGQSVGDQALTLFARSSAANFLVESSGEGTAQSFRLFHQALDDALLTRRARGGDRVGDDRAIARAFLAHGRAMHWAHAPAYLLKSLPSHAARAGLLDELLGDDEFLLYADLPRLATLGDETSTTEGRDRVRLLRLTPQAVRATATERGALFSVTEALERLGTSYRSSGRPTPYRARWAATSSRTERIALEGHVGGVRTICSFTSGTKVLLASGGHDGTVRIWDPRSGEAVRTLEGHKGSVHAVCAFASGGRSLLASGGSDGTVRIWDPRSGQTLRTLNASPGSISGICSFMSAGRPLLAIVGYQMPVWIWDPNTGISQSFALKADIQAVGAFEFGNETLLALATDGGSVITWDPNTGAELEHLTGHRSVASGDTMAGRHYTYTVWGVCVFSSEGRILLASAGHDGTVRTWDPLTGMALRTLKGHQGADPNSVNGVCAFPADNGGGRPGADPGSATLLASAGADGTVRIWDPQSGAALRTLTGHHGRVNGVCEFALEKGHSLLASAGADGIIRIWDPQAATVRKSVDEVGPVNGLCVLSPGPASGNDLVMASAGHDKTVRTWKLHTGEALHTMRGHTDEVNDVSACSSGGRAVLASAAKDGKVRIWDPETGVALRVLRNHALGVDVICSYTASDHDWLISAGHGLGLLTPGAGFGLIGYKMRIRDARTWETARTLGLLDGISSVSPVTAICTVNSDDGTLLAFAPDNGKIRIWNPASGKTLFSLDNERRSLGLCAFSSNGRTLLASARSDTTVNIWDLRSRTRLHTLEGHTGTIKGICAFVSGQRMLLASVSTDRTMRIWDPETSENLMTIPTHHEGWAVQSGTDNLLAVGLSAGLLVLELTEIDVTEMH